MNGEAKEEVRSKLDIEAVIGEYVQLKRAGRNWKGLSPFSHEKTPSFIVSPEKGIWHDFSSNQGGDIFSFIMLVEGLDFRAALELLARKAGVDLSQYEQKTGANRGLAEKKRRLLAMHESATTFYQRSLFADANATAYVKNRGLNRQVVHDFRLGYAPDDGKSLLRFLIKKGYTAQDMRDGGLLNSRGTDMFRSRLMVPLMDAQGQVIGFTARILKDIPHAPKYLNTPQTVLYDKGRHVFGLHLAKESIRKQSQAVIVEGNLDVISSHQAGVANVVATAGTALTDHHLKVLSRLSDRIALGFDADKAGIAATERAIPMAQTVNVELSIVSLPDGAKDPDELIQRDVASWQRAIDDSLPAIDWVIAQYEARSDISTAHGKRQLTTEALQLLRHVEDAVEQEHYLKALSKKTDTSIETLRSRMEQLDQQQATQPRKTIQQPPQVQNQAQENPRQDHLLALMCISGEVRDIAQVLSVDAFEGDARRALFRYLITHAGQSQFQDIPPDLQPHELYVKIVQLKAETRYVELSAQERALEANHLVGQIKQQHIKQRKSALVTLLRDAEAAGEEAEILRLRNELNALIKEEHTRGKS